MLPSSIRTRHIDFALSAHPPSFLTALWRCYTVTTEMGTCSDFADANLTVILLPGIEYQGASRKLGAVWSVLHKYLWILPEVEILPHVVGFALRDSCMCQLLVAQKAKP
ncbi:hypothetical protein CkaCkLH20_06531 [Colletotrichum karsti]|uniref:Uncharacterized protein n=1 Tax=Colletotrichum karsti TaxID=1095194 RepID=A0A9P6ICG8_9PEZI|nr:uncharacterized protein CkaCkLH20_06531 [Colletotrichum karsti]KAF9876085.1 hypothetical protein CkaCkLH20_06531 [Colletotrichum karsti]